MLDVIGEAVREQALGNTLPADAMLGRLFGRVAEWPSDDTVLGRARDRVTRGRAPGKGGSHGDAITWEAVLAHHEWGQDLSLISRDGDYASPLESGKIHPHLATEFSGQMAATITLYDSMSSYFRTKWPDIHLSSEVEAAIATEKLAKSYSFAQTHVVIAELNTIPTFSRSQAITLCEIALANDQVTRVLGDEDVHEFFDRLLSDHLDSLPAETASTLNDLLHPGPGVF